MNRVIINYCGWIAGLVLLVFLCLGADSGKAADAPSLVKIHLPGYSTSSLPFLITDELGFYRDEGIRIEITRIQTGSGIQALVAGAVVLEGRGATTIWQEGGAKQTFEWQTGSLFVIPLNAWFQHFNGSGAQTARYIAFTSAPLMMNLLNDEEFIFNCPHIFRNRFDGETDYFKGEGSYYGERIWDVNFIANIHDLSLKVSAERGRGNRTTIIEIGCSALIAHMSQFSVGRYKKAHRHAAGAQIIILEGARYSLLWPEGSEPKRCDWQPNSIVSPPDQWFHQHFNTSDRETRYLAIRWNSKKYKVFKDIVDRSVKEGGTQIEYEDEDPKIRRDFEAELAKRGITSRMS